MKKAAVFPGKYIQGEGVLKELGELIKPFNVKKPMLLWGKRTRAATADIVYASLKEAGMEAVERMLPGECTHEECANIVADIKEKGATSSSVWAAARRLISPRRPQTTPACAT